MNTILINPPGRGSWQGDPSKKAIHYMAPYSVLFVHNYLLKQGINSEMYDLYCDDPKLLWNRLASLEKVVVGVTTHTYHRFETIEIIKKIKAICPHAVIVVGGKHFSCCQGDTFLNVPEIDIIVRGDGEITFLETVNCLERGGELSTVDGISFRRDKETIYNKDRLWEKDVDQFAIDHKIVSENFKKGIYLSFYEGEQKKALPIHAGRGCPMNCIYCSYPIIRYRMRKAENVVRDMIEMKELFGIDSFEFIGPCFMGHRRFLREFCEILIHENTGITWYSEGRTDTPLELLELMAKAGCISLAFGVESGSAKVLKAIGKRPSTNTSLEFAKQCKLLGIRNHAFFLISLQEETEEDAWQTLRIAGKFADYTDHAHVNVTVILPGTGLEQRAKQLGLLPEAFSWYDPKYIHSDTNIAPAGNIIYLEHLSLDFIRKMQNEYKKLFAAKYTTSLDLLHKVRAGLMRIPHQGFSQNLSAAKNFGIMLGRKIASYRRSQ